MSETRRTFLTAAAGLAATGASGAAPKSSAKSKVGCCSWNIHGYAPGSNAEAAVETIGELGFDAVELILLAPQDVGNYWTDPTLDRIKKKIERYHLQLTQFVVFMRAVPDLASQNAEARARTLDIFEAGCKIAQKLGAPIVNLSSPWAEEMKGPGEVLVNYFDVNDPKPGEKYHINFAPGFTWGEVWQRYVQTTRECVARAKAHALHLTIEPHTNCLVHDATAFLRLWDTIRDPALGCNLDIGFAARAREYPPLAIYQLNEHLMNLHMRDVDGLMRKFVPFGDGVMDAKAIADALKAIGYQGGLSIEQDRTPQVKVSCARYLETMRQHLV